MSKVKVTARRSQVKFANKPDVAQLGVTMTMYMGINYKLLNIFQEYLSNRLQRVTIEGCSSDWEMVKSGVPQGSVLGPFLFLVYINDIRYCIKGNVKIGIFADDVKIWSCINSQYDVKCMQESLDAMFYWSQTWGMSFNIRKCVKLTFRKRTNTVYTINGIPLNEVTSFCDLGVTICNNFKWSLHIDNTVSKALKMLGLIKRCLGKQAPKSAKQIAYTAMVRSILLYACQVWTPTTKDDMVRVERVQKLAIKFIDNVNFQQGVSYKESLTACNLLPLNLTLEYYNLCFIFNVLHGRFKIDSNSLFREMHNARVTRTAVQTLILHVPRAKGVSYKMWFNVRGCYMWNSLPEAIRAITPADKENGKIDNIFKKRLLNYLGTVFEDNYDNHMLCTWKIWCGCATCRNV